MKPEDQVYRRLALRDADPSPHVSKDHIGWSRAGLYVTLVLARIAKMGPTR